jgi:hypothetical protein
VGICFGALLVVVVVVVTTTTVIIWSQFIFSLSDARRGRRQVEKEWLGVTNPHDCETIDGSVEL